MSCVILSIAGKTISGHLPRIAVDLEQILGSNLRIGSQSYDIPTGGERKARDIGEETFIIPRALFCLGLGGLGIDL